MAATVPIEGVGTGAVAEQPRVARLADAVASDGVTVLLQCARSTRLALAGTRHTERTFLHAHTYA